jgi:HAD superfamily hydrolase (TIGR01509 family)
MIQGAIFDVDGTLLNSMPIWDNAGAIYLKSLGIEAEPELGKTMFSMSMTEGAQYLYKKYQLQSDTEEIINGINHTIEDFYLNQVQLKPGVEQFLQEMKQSGIHMTIATSSDRCVIEKALERLKVLPLFERIFTCSEVGAGKNKPDIYIAARESMCSKTSATWVFEDALHALWTAKNAGFKTVGIYDATSENTQEEIKEISDVYMYEMSNFSQFLVKV